VGGGEVAIVATSVYTTVDTNGDSTMPELKLRRTGNSLSTSWPKEALARLNAKEGDTLYAVETPQGYLITPFDPKFTRTMEAAERVFRRNKNAYRELSKR
jgi:putative addiction module antidote